MGVRTLNSIKETVKQIREATENFIDLYRFNERSGDAVFYGKLDFFFDERLKLIELYNTMEIQVREAFGFVPSSMSDLFKIRDSLKKLKSTSSAEQIFLFRELAYSFLDRLEKGLNTSDPIVVLVKETSYEESMKEFKSAIKKLSHSATTMSVLKYICESGEFVSAKDISRYLGKTEKTAREELKKLTESLGLFLAYETIGKQTYIKATPRFIQMFMEASQYEL